MYENFFKILSVAKMFLFFLNMSGPQLQFPVPFPLCHDITSNVSLTQNHCGLPLSVNKQLKALLHNHCLEPSHLEHVLSPSPLCPCWQPWQLPGQPSDSGHAGTRGPCAAVASSCLTANMSHVTSLHRTHMELHKMLVSN